MRPVLFHVNLFGNAIPIPSYLVFAVAGFLFAWVLMGILAKKEGMLTGRFVVAAVMLSMSMVLGGRLLYVFHSPEQFHSIRDVLHLSTKGFAVMGGLLLMGVLSVPLLVSLGQDRRKFWDLAAAPVALGLALGRIGCFLAGCCFGKVTDSCLGVHFPWGSQAHRFQIREGILGLFQTPLPVYPTQLFELAALLLIGILALRLYLRKVFPSGTTAVVAFLLYMVFRLCNLGFRADPAGALEVWIYPLGYLLAIVGCIFWGFLLTKKTRRIKDET